jgi:hypothetical protein
VILTRWQFPVVEEPGGGHGWENASVLKRSWIRAGRLCVGHFESGGCGGAVPSSRPATKKKFPALQNTTGPNGNEDYWNLNFGTLLTNAGQSANTPINGFLLYADSTGGEKVGSDPYFITSIGGFTPVLEASTYIGGFALIALVIARHAKDVLKRRSQSA